MRLIPLKQTDGCTLACANWALIDARYSIQLDFVLWRPEPIRLVQQRRVFIYSEA